LINSTLPSVKVQFNSKLLFTSGFANKSIPMQSKGMLNIKDLRYKSQKVMYNPRAIPPSALSKS
jgi:hypothetical protein